MIPEYKTILYATDLAVNARQVFKTALSIAERFNARIHIVHVVPEMDASHLNYLSALIGEEKFKERELKLNEEIIQTLSGRLERLAKEELETNPEAIKLVAGIEVLHGHPVDQILKAATRHSADLLVLGSHGKGPIEHTWLGSVVQKTLRKSRYPVLVVPVPE
ncbi:MAG: universal stress protein [Desulfuromonadales bacterium]|nr:universal stress protein [Desulfuromonadales bacterium]